MKLYLRVFEFSVYLCCVTVFIVLSRNLTWNYWMLSWQIIWLGLSCFMTLVTLLSWRHINKRSVALEQFGIQTNRVLMSLYSIWWVCFSLISASIIILGVEVTMSFSQQDMMRATKNSDQADESYFCSMLKLTDLEMQKFLGWTDKHDPVTVLRYCTAISYLFVVAWIFMGFLDIKMLIIYYKFGDRMSD